NQLVILPSKGDNPSRRSQPGAPGGAVTVKAGTVNQKRCGKSARGGLNYLQTILAPDRIDTGPQLDAPPELLDQPGEPPADRPMRADTRGRHAEPREALDVGFNLAHLFRGKPGDRQFILQAAAVEVVEQGQFSRPGGDNHLA